MPISKRIRHRLVTVLLLGVITSALSLVALVRVITLTTEQRIERARLGVRAEAVQLAGAFTADGAGGASAKAGGAPGSSALIGARGGIWVSSESNAPAGLPGAWRATFEEAVSNARQSRRAAAAEEVVDGGVVVVAAEPVPNGRAAVAWAAYLVAPPTWLRIWRFIVVALALTTALLVTSAIVAVISVTRGASALNIALDGLANDLQTPVPRPALRELGDVADGIARLAERLIQARGVQAALSQELAKKERLAALGRVVAGVAHEVRNPLASIKLRLDLATNGTSALPAPVMDAIAHATREITRLDRLVADLLVVASPGIGPPQESALGSLVRARVDALAPWTALRGVKVEVAGDAFALIDVDAVARALDNLIRNAVEASPVGGVVTVLVSEAAAGALSLGIAGGATTDNGDRVSIRIADRGSGVPAARSHELFEPFFTTKPDGTGLGLAICRSIARAHDGEVTFTRTDGTTWVELTLARPPRSTGDRATAANAGGAFTAGARAG